MTPANGAGAAARMTRAGLRGLSLQQIHHVRPVAPRRAPAAVARVYREIEQQFGVLAPPIALHSPSPAVQSASWVMLRETLLVQGLTTRALKEAVAVSVSELNECPFCVSVHTPMMTSQLTFGPPLVGAPTSSEEQVRAVQAWALKNGRRTPEPGESVPLSPDQTAELVGVAVMMHYLNRMVNIFLEARPLPPGTPKGALTVISPILTWLQRSAQKSRAQAGTSLGLLPSGAPAATPPAWAGHNQHLADAFGAAAAVIEQAGQDSVPAAVRVLVHSHLSAWDGSPAPLSRSWVEEAIAGVEAGDRPAARLALLTARASYQIDDAVIADFKAAHPEDRTLIDLTSWASLTTALEIGSWMRYEAPAAPRQ